MKYSMKGSSLLVGVPRASLQNILKVHVNFEIAYTSLHFGTQRIRGAFWGDQKFCLSKGLLIPVLIHSQNYFERGLFEDDMKFLLFCH